VLTELMAERSTTWLVRRPATTPSARLCDMAARLERSRSAGAESRSSARGCTAPGRSQLRPAPHFADRDPPTKVVLEQMLAGVSTRRLARTREPALARTFRP